MRLRPRNYTGLSITQVLGWADYQHAGTGSWPTAESGAVLGDLNEKWRNIDTCLRMGLRGLPGGCSLAGLLTRERGVRWRNLPPPLTEDDVLAWAERHRLDNGAWPSNGSGPVADRPGENWRNIDAVLRRGGRGLPGGSSLAELLAARRGKRNRSWADRHREGTGQYPTHQSGAVAGADGETWCGIDMALRQALRGLPGGSSLARLLSERRGQRNRMSLPPLTEAAVVSWADAFKRRKGRHPARSDGPVGKAPGESWGAIDVALKAGARGLAGGSSLARLLARECGYVHQGNRPPLTVQQILRWADAEHALSGRWPSSKAGAVPGAPGETWGAIDAALRGGRRGLEGGSSLVCLLAEARRCGHRLHPDRLGVAQVLAWADEYHRRTGFWPDQYAGPVAPGSSVTWSVVNDCLRKGRRGLPGGTTLFRFLHRHGRRTAQ